MITDTVYNHLCMESMKNRLILSRCYCGFKILCRGGSHLLPAPLITGTTPNKHYTLGTLLETHPLRWEIKISEYV